MALHTSSYTFVTSLGKGGMGTVDLVMRRQDGFQRMLAQKRLLPAFRQDPDLRTMFLEEARLAGKINHRHVVPVLDVGEDDDGPFLVMDYVDGAPLSELLRATGTLSAQLPLHFCVELALAVARGLDAIHRLADEHGRPLGLIHRDITPHNVMVGWDGSVRITDFGIAKSVGQNATSTGVLKGKMGYMSPEQLRFQDPDQRCDLFSFGVMFFELLAARRLYGSGGTASARSILESPPPDLAYERDDAPPSLVSLLFDLLAKDPSERPESATSVVRELEAIQKEVGGGPSIEDVVNRRFSSQRDRSRRQIKEALESQRALSGTPDPSEGNEEPKREGPAQQPPRRSTAMRWVLPTLLVAAVGSGVLITRLESPPQDDDVPTTELSPEPTPQPTSPSVVAVPVLPASREESQPEAAEEPQEAGSMRPRRRRATMDDAEPSMGGTADEAPATTMAEEVAATPMTETTSEMTSGMTGASPNDMSVEPTLGNESDLERVLWPSDID